MHHVNEYSSCPDPSSCIIHFQNVGCTNLFVCPRKARKIKNPTISTNKKLKTELYNIFLKAINNQKMSSGIQNPTIETILEKEDDSGLVRLLRQTIANLSGQLDAIRKRLAESTKEGAKLTEENEKIKKKNEEMKHELTKLKQQLEDATQQIETLGTQLNPPLIELPNFSLVPVPLLFYEKPSPSSSMPLHIVFYEEGIYEVHGFTKILEDMGFKSDDTTIFGALSTFGKITLNTRLDKINLGLPLDVHDFCFVYPWSISDNAKIKQLIGDGLVDKIKTKVQEYGDEYTSIVDLLFFGGYLYRDENKKTIKLASLKVGAGLTFDPPVKVSPFSVPFAEILSGDNINREGIAQIISKTQESRVYDIMISLFKNGRFQPVTINALWSLGARLFAWLAPNEFLEFNIPYGAFIYINDRLEMSCLIRVNSITSRNYTEASFTAVCSNGKWVPPTLSSTEEPPSCQICFSGKPEIVFSPCGHCAVCDSCSRKLNICPYCRGRIIERIKIFMVVE